MPLAAAIKTYLRADGGRWPGDANPRRSITATASGMLVTKATSDSSLGQDIGNQFESAAGPIQLGSFILMGLSLMPGMPTASVPRARRAVVNSFAEG